jgi:hypothetical protein
VEKFKARRLKGRKVEHWKGGCPDGHHMFLYYLLSSWQEARLVSLLTHCTRSSNREGNLLSVYRKVYTAITVVPAFQPSVGNDCQYSSWYLQSLLPLRQLFKAEA